MSATSLPQAPAAASGVRKQPFSNAFLTALLGLFAMALYLPAIGYDFVYDSEAQIFFDPFLHNPKHFWDIITFRVMGMDVLDFNRPVVLLSLFIDAQLYGKDTPGYHLTNLLIYAGCVMLLYRLLLQLTRRPLPSFLATLAYAAHPLLVEPVVEVGFREDLLVGLFLLAGLCTAARIGKSTAALVATVVFFFLAVASKESGVAGLPVLAAYWWLFHRGEPKKPWLIAIGATALTLGGFLAVRFALEPETSLIFTDKPQRIASGIRFLIVQSRIWTGEFLRIIWPTELNPDYNGYAIRNISVVTGPLTIVGVLAVQGFLAWRSRLFALGAVLFWASLLPASNILPMYKPMADRFLYAPLLGVAVMLAAGLCCLWPAVANWRDFFTPVRTATLAAVVAGIGTLSCLTTVQRSYWVNSLTLWGRSRELNPYSESAQMGYAYALLNAHRAKEALQPFVAGVELTKRSYAGAFAGYALAAEAAGRHEDAVKALQVAGSLDARYREPDKLEPALLFSASQIATLKVILLRAKTL